jgi:hypothetical protein
MGASKAMVSRFKTFVVARFHLALENLALRQQLKVLKRSGKRPELRPRDRVFWVLLSALWPDWRSALVIVKPETVMGWRRRGFRLCWCWKSRSRKSGRPPINEEIRQLIRRMSQENLTWGAPRIESELRLLGYAVAERTVAKYMVRAPSSPTQTWRTFLKNHSLEMMDIDVVKACKSTLHHVCRLAILSSVLRLTSLIRSAMTGWDASFGSGEAATVVFGGCDRATTCRVRQCTGAKTREERPVMSSEPRCRLLRFKPTQIRERGPPRKEDRNLTSAETGIHRVAARAA